MSECTWLIDSETGALHPVLMKNIDALRAVVENPELVLVAVPNDAEFATNKLYDSLRPGAMQYLWLWERDHEEDGE